MEQSTNYRKNVKKKIRGFQDTILHAILEDCDIRRVSTHLKTSKVINSDELESISKASNRREANGNFYEILDGDPSQRKLKILAEVLFTDETHDGHKELAEEVERFLKELESSGPSPVALGSTSMQIHPPTGTQRSVSLPSHVDKVPPKDAFLSKQLQACTVKPNLQGENEGHLLKISGHDLAPHETRESSFQRSTSIKMDEPEAITVGDVQMDTDHTLPMVRSRGGAKDNISTSEAPSHMKSTIPTNDMRTSERVLEEVNYMDIQPMEPVKQMHVTTTSTPTKEVSLEEKYSFKKGFKLRPYQEELAELGISGHNYVVCAPTGSGKTAVAAAVIASHLKKREGKGKVVFIVSRVPLARQQSDHLKSYLPNLNTAIDYTHGTREVALKAILQTSEIVVCTHGTFYNDLKRNNVKMSDISLLVLDECHNARRASIYAQIMHEYLSAKLSRNENVPQVVGLTATPGAGRSKEIALSDVQTHLIDLCALLDASRGYCIVEKYKQNLDDTVFSASIEVCTTSGRDSTDLFLSEATTFMEEIEKDLDVQPPGARDDISYLQWIEKLRNQLFANSEGRDREEFQKISLALNFLEAYSSTIAIYKDLAAPQALDNLVESLHQYDDPESHPNAFLQYLIRRHSKIQDKLQHLASKYSESEHLRRLKDLLSVHFLYKPNTKAIIFAQTKYHAIRISKWISDTFKFNEIKIRADFCIGHKGEGRDDRFGMTSKQQYNVLQKFREDKVNVLVATSVLEEGLDVPDCNLIIRFLYVKDEISRKQTGGRGRSKDTRHYALLESGSKEEQREKLNQFKDQLVECALELMKSKSLEALSSEISSRQIQILKVVEEERFRKQKRKAYIPEQVTLFCKGCRAFVCNGQDLRVIENSHHVVMDQSIWDRVIVKTHEAKGKDLPKGTLKKEKKISCKICEYQRWGISCIFPNSCGLELPVLKCKDLVFEYYNPLIGIGTTSMPHSKWTQALFEVEDYDSTKYNLGKYILSSEQ